MTRLSRAPARLPIQVFERKKRTRALLALVTPARALVLAATALVLVLFIYEGVIRAPSYYTTVHDGIGTPDLGGSDFTAFFGGTKLLLHDARHAYDAHSQAVAILHAKGNNGEPGSDGAPWYRYYNPPFYSLLLSPLTLLPELTAYELTFVLNGLALLALFWVLGAILRWRQPETGLLFLAVLTSIPLYYAFWHSQPTLLMAALFGGAFLAVERGKTGRAAVLIGFMSIKPQWLLVTGLVCIVRRPRIVKPLLLVCFVLLLPFLIIGVHGTLDYVRLVLGRGAGDVTDLDFSGAVLSWSGFLRAISGTPKPDEALALSVLTMLPFALTWLQKEPRLLPPALVLTTLLVVPHSHPQDWIMVAPAAAFLLDTAASDPDRRIVEPLAVMALLGIYVGVDAWHGIPTAADRPVYWATLAAFALLLVIAGWSLWPRLARSLARREQEPALVAPLGEPGE